MASSIDAAGHIGHVEDIIPPGPWGPGQYYDPDNGAIWLNDCRNLDTIPDAPTLIQATCRGGVVAPPDVVLPEDTLGVRYSVAPTDLGDGASIVEVTVTATLVLGYDWGSPMPPGWEIVDARTATWTGTLQAASCAAIKPVRPTVIEAECVDGALKPPSLQPATTDKISYTVDPAEP